MSRWSTTLFLGLVTILAGTTAYFASKSITLEKHLTRSEQTQTPVASTTPRETPTATPTATVSSTPEETVTPTTSPTGGSTTPVSAPASLALAKRLSQPAQTHTVATGETLSPIGEQYSIRWERIVEANNLANPDQLQIDQVLIIPAILDQAKKLVGVKYTVDPAKAATVQSAVDQGSDDWRLDPAATAAAEAGVYGLTNADDYKVVDKDTTKGTATVTATKVVEGKTLTYQVTLIQPATKGEKGIWALSVVQPKV